MTFPTPIPVSRYDFPNDFIDRICTRYLDGINPEAWDYAWDMIYDACRVEGPRAAVHEARYYAGYFAR